MEGVGITPERKIQAKMHAPEMAPTPTTVESPSSAPSSAASATAPHDAAALAVAAVAMGLPAPASAPSTRLSEPSLPGSKRKATEPLTKPSAARTSHARGRSFLNHQQRLEILKKKDEEPKWTQVQLARWAAVHLQLPREPSQATIAVLLKKRDQLKSATVRPQTRTIRPPRHPELEAALLLWVRHLQSKNVPFTGENIRLKAASLATELGISTTLNFSTGWMSGFVSRHNLLLARAHKKKQSEHDDEPVRALLKSYDPRDVFALHTTSIIYNDLPYSREHESIVDSERDRVCIGLAVNVDSSEKLEPLIVTTCQRKFGVFAETFYNVEGTMTARIFEQWLYKLNHRMTVTHRKIVVLVNAKPSYFPMHLSHVRLIVLPVVMAVRTHPLEGSVVKSFKALYRKTHLSFAVDQAEEGRARVFDISIARALNWIKQAWLDVSPELIRTCWMRTGLVALRTDASAPTDIPDIPAEVVQSLVVSLSQFQLLETMPIETLVNSEAEENVHYEYDDATVVRIVAGETNDDAEHESDVGSMAEEDNGQSKVPGDVAFGARSGEMHYFEKEPSTEELLTNYRGVIWSLDADTERTADQQIALRVLRQKQAALRFQHQQELAAQATTMEEETPIETANDASSTQPPSATPDVVI